jgi:hypothetical protein
MYVGHNFSVGDEVSVEGGIGDPKNATFSSFVEELPGLACSQQIQRMAAELKLR